MTELLYYADPLLREFTTTIASIDPDRLVVTLAATAFYPEGGGQPADLGTVADTPVVDVQKSRNGAILHRLESPLPATIKPGDTVHGQVDWPHRHEYMQQHTGQHVLSGALMRAANAPTVSVHQGSDVTTIEVDRERLSDADLQAVDDLANSIIAENRAIRTRWIDDSELSTVSLRRPTDRTGRIRLVEIEDFDLVACGGVHLPRTGLLNLVQLVSVERIRGRLRLGYKIGDRALADYREKHRAITAVADLFSARPDQAPERVAATIDELKEKNGVLRRRAERIATMILATIPESDEPESDEPETLLLKQEDQEVFRAIAEGATDDSSRRLVLGNVGSERIDWAIIIGSDHDFPAEALRRELLTPFGAKGGGKPPLWRGVLSDTAATKAKEFLSAAVSVIAGAHR